MDLHADPTAATHPHHRLSVGGQRGALHLDLHATLSAPWTVLFGPSGCGKSTVLRALCGLTPALHTEITRSTQGSWEPLDPLSPERRQLAYAPQHAVLFPHLTVLQNIRFAHTVRSRGTTSSKDLSALIELFELQPLLHRRPHHLSGGERQRVSLARAFAVPAARLMLLDEPFAGLDRALRDALLPRIRIWLADQQLPVLSVTHDIDEALLLQAEVIRLQAGRNVAQGPAPEVLAPEVQRLLRILSL